MAHPMTHLSLEVELTLQHSVTAKDGDITQEQWQDWFEQWLNILDLEIEPTASYTVSLVITTDQQIQSLNATYRNHDAPTDVLAFACLEDEYAPEGSELEGEPTHLGDIVISADTALRQAQEQGHDLNTELIWLACHGFLHLLGWDHPNAEELNAMLTQQAQLIQAIGWVPPCWSTEDLGYV